MGNATKNSKSFDISGCIILSNSWAEGFTWVSVLAGFYRGKLIIL